MLGCVGRDLYGQMSRQALERSGVDVSLVSEQEGPTGVAVITVCQGDNCIILDAGANGKVLPPLLESSREAFDWADLVLLQLEIPMETVLLAAAWQSVQERWSCSTPPPCSPFLTNCGGWRTFSPPTRWKLPSCSACPGEVSAQDAPQALELLRQKGVPYPLITLGGAGCAYYDGEQYRHRSAYPVEPVDTTAAGDSFMGGLAVALSRGSSLAQAVDYATAVSAIAVTRPGATASIPTAAEVKKFINDRDKNL